MLLLVGPHAQWFATEKGQCRVQEEWTLILDVQCRIHVLILMVIALPCVHHHH